VDRRKLARKDGAHRVDIRAAEFGGDREQVMDAWRLVMLTALDVAAYEGCDREVMIGQLGVLCVVRMVPVGHASSSSVRSAR
jgi:hypothetical protein